MYLLHPRDSPFDDLRWYPVEKRSIAYFMQQVTDGYGVSDYREAIPGCFLLHDELNITPEAANLCVVAVDEILERVVR